MAKHVAICRTCGKRISRRAVAHAIFQDFLYSLCLKYSFPLSTLLTKPFFIINCSVKTRKKPVQRGERD